MLLGRFSEKIQQRHILAPKIWYDSLQSREGIYYIFYKRQININLTIVLYLPKLISSIELCRGTASLRYTNSEVKNIEKNVTNSLKISISCLDSSFQNYF